MHGWQANKKRTCAQPVLFRVIPENEIPRASARGLFYGKNTAVFSDSADFSVFSAQISTVSENAAQHKCRKMCYNIGSCNRGASPENRTGVKNKALYETNR